MGLSEEVARSAGIPIVIRGSGEYVCSTNVERFLREARARGLGVLGLEGFQLLKDATIPDMSAILDLSELERSTNCVDESIDQALSFVRDINDPGMYFDVTLEGQSQ